MPKGLGLLNGTLYVVDSHNSRVLMFTAYELRYIGSFGSRGIEPGRMSHPEGLCIWNGEVFVADSGNDRIQVFNERGVLKRWFRVPGRSAGHAMMPTALSAADDRMYVLGETDGEDGRMLQVINATGSLLQTITVGGTLGTWGRLSHVLVTKQSSSQRLYAVDSDWHRVHVFTIRHERERTHSGTWEKSKERNTHHNVGKH
ncbi:hypothetical protein AB1Y20_008857 [Prymnesium parvum]|uniref:Peptidylamidoglycolate lyase n=1 Tax=Prymnesium parvum TaxID=97485 RepID=A0AB34IUC1_PRYPA